MPRNSPPIRTPSDVYDSAVAASLLTSRSVPQQIAHWARIGRELEMSPGVNHRIIAQVLAGAVPYDSLSESEQAILRGEWADRMTTRLAGLNYEAEFTAAGEPYSELNDNGDVVAH